MLIWVSVVSLLVLSFICVVVRLFFNWFLCLVLMIMLVMIG